jgi:hypothetical protein
VNETSASGHGSLLPLRRLGEWAWARTAAGRRPARITSAGLRGTMLTSRTRRSIANIGVVLGQSTQLLYPGPGPAGRAHAHAYMHETTQGIYERCCRADFAFDFVHEDRLEPERLGKYRALLLPNIAMLSDRQCRQIRDYVRAGGSIMASFETGLYDENLKPRAGVRTGRLYSASARPATWSAPKATHTTPHRAPASRSLKASPTPTGFPERRIASR